MAAIVQIERQSPTSAHWQISEYESAIGTSSRLMIVAEEGAHLLGFLVASTATLEWELENIAVAPAERHRGIGRSLMNALIASAQAGGALEIRQEIRASNLAAQRLGHELGFAQEGRRPGYYCDPDEDALLFKYLVK
ncbi:MAG TPA: ribosomal protein S18-alanine N-acetyltransferase [Terriglobales bacterium]|nr:ribosomal protein S18-alanine N-acetyltransferase [Terriglobales bacterium]